MMGAARAAARCGDFSGIGCTRVGEAAVCTIGLGRADEGRSIRVAGLTDLVGRAGLYPLRATVAILVALAYGPIEEIGGSIDRGRADAGDRLGGQY